MECRKKLWTLNPTPTASPPHVHTCPSSSTAAVKKPPHATCRILPAGRPSTSMGRGMQPSAAKCCTTIGQASRPSPSSLPHVKIAPGGEGEGERGRGEDRRECSSKLPGDIVYLSPPLLLIYPAPHEGGAWKVGG